MSAVPSLLIRGDLTDLLTESCVAKMREVHPDMALLSVPRVGHAPMLNEVWRYRSDSGIFDCSERQGPALRIG